MFENRFLLVAKDEFELKLKDEVLGGARRKAGSGDEYNRKDSRTAHNVLEAGHKSYQKQQLLCFCTPSTVTILKTLLPVGPFCNLPPADPESDYPTRNLANILSKYLLNQ